MHSTQKRGNAVALKYVAGLAILIEKHRGWCPIKLQIAAMSLASFLGFFAILAFGILEVIHMRQELITRASYWATHTHSSRQRCIVDMW